MITLIFALDVSLIYICMLYKLNGGHLHVYFVITVFMGFYFGFKIKKALSNCVKKIKFIDKIIKK